MGPELVGLTGFAVLMIVMFLGVPVALTLILVGFAGLVILAGWGPAASSAAMSFTTSISDYVLATIPVFLLMGEMADISGMMKNAYRSAAVWMGNVRGGLAMASILGAAAFSAVSGTSMACAAIMSRIALPRLVEHKYDPALASGSLAAGGTLGNLIPPGVLLVFYAIMTEVSLSKLYVASMVPGLLLMVMYMAQIYIQCRINPKLGPGAGSTTWKEKLAATKGIMATAITFALVMGGIQFGVFTANEAASMGAVFVFAYAVIKKTVNGQNMRQAFRNTLVVAGMSFAIVVGANIFSTFIVLSNLAQALAAWLVGMDLPVIIVIILMMLVYFVLGIPMNAITMLLLTLPLFVPVLKAYHVDLVWFGVLVVIQMELANLSPPVGMNLFVTASIAKPYGISLGTVFRGAIPFCLTLLVVNALLIAFPQIAMWLVGLMKS